MSAHSWAAIIGVGQVLAMSIHSFTVSVNTETACAHAHAHHHAFSAGLAFDGRRFYPLPPDSSSPHTISILHIYRAKCGYHTANAGSCSQLMLTSNSSNTNMGKCCAMVTGLHWRHYCLRCSAVLSLPFNSYHIRHSDPTFYFKSSVFQVHHIG